MPVSCNAVRRGKLTAGGITSRVALYDTCGIMEMNSGYRQKSVSLFASKPQLTSPVLAV